MTDQKHAKEPWNCDNDGRIYDAEGNLIAAFIYAYPECAVDIELEDAKRIVECVNACAGIEPPIELRKQRDELLERLGGQCTCKSENILEKRVKRIEEWIENWSVYDYGYCNDQPTLKEP